MNEVKPIGKLIDSTAFWQNEIDRCHGLPLVGTDVSNNVYLDSRLRAAPAVNIEDIWPHTKCVDLIPADKKRWDYDCLFECKNCGERFKDDRYKFCPGCGYKIDRD